MITTGERKNRVTEQPMYQFNSIGKVPCWIHPFEYDSSQFIVSIPVLTVMHMHIYIHNIT